VLNDGRQNMFACAMVTNGSGQLRVIAHSRTFYDGEEFVGLPLGQIGDFGAVVRSESLVFTDDFLDNTFDPSDPLTVSPWPVYLKPQGVTAWPSDYPDEFKNLLPNLAGYVHYTDGDLPGSPGGYFAVFERHRYDFHDVGHVARGLPRVTEIRWEQTPPSSMTMIYSIVSPMPSGLRLRPV
jgi:hypothetical protein